MIEIKTIVNSILGSNSFLLTNNESADVWLIDAGDVESVFNYIDLNNKVLKGILLTHTHFDHIYGLNSLIAKYPKSIVYTSYHGYQGLFSDKLNMSRYHLQPFVFQYNNVETVKEGTKIRFFDRSFVEVYETPGHDWSSLCYRIDDAFFTGDSYLPSYKVIASFPKSNKEEAAKSLSRINRLISGCDVYPGHGEIVYQ